MPNYGAGNSLFLGAAEQGTGYLNPLNNRISYFSDLGSSPVLPESLTGQMAYLPKLSLFPNEGYTLKRSELVFHPQYADVMYLGNGSSFYKSTDKGANFTALHDFGNATAGEIEQSRSNPDVIYHAIFNDDNAYNDRGEIYKSTDGGDSWTKLPDLPATRHRELQLAINPEDEDELWVGNIYGYDGEKVYRTTDGGSSWQNMTTATLDGEQMRDIVYQPGIGKDIIYVATYYGVFYYDSDSTDWINMSAGLPYILDVNEMQPFYRDCKIRAATYGRAIWESSLAAPVRPLAQPITNTDSVFCARDTVQFDSYSIVTQGPATAWQWSFSPAPLYVSSTTVRNPKVVFGADGNYDVTLTVTDDSSNTHSKTIVDMIKVANRCEASSEAGNALETYGDGDYLAITEANLGNISHFTTTAWIKPAAGQAGFGGIISNGNWCAHCDDDPIGLIIDYWGNRLWYRWHGTVGSWGGNSGIDVPIDEWSYVAMVVTPDTITLYLNEEKYTAAGTFSTVDFSSLYLSLIHI